MAITDGTRPSVGRRLTDVVLILGGWAATIAVLFFDPGGGYGSVSGPGFADGGSEMDQNHRWGEGTLIVSGLVVILMAMAMIDARRTYRRDGLDIRTVVSERAVGLVAPTIAGVLATLVLVWASEAHQEPSRVAIDAAVFALVLTTMALALAEILRILRHFVVDVRIFSVITVGLTTFPWLFLLRYIKTNTGFAIWALFWIPIAIVVIGSIRAPRSRASGAGWVHFVGFFLGVCVWSLGGLIDLLHFRDIFDGSGARELDSFGFPYLAGPALEAFGLASVFLATVVLVILYVAGCRSSVAAWLSPVIIVGLYVLAAILWEPQMWIVR